MEIIITDKRVDEHSYSKSEIVRGYSISFDKDKIYLESGYCLNFPFKIIIESSSIVKLSGKSCTKKSQKDSVKCIDERDKKIACSGIVVNLETRRASNLPESFDTWIYLNSGYLIYMRYTETDLRNIIEASSNEEKS